MVTAGDCTVNWVSHHFLPPDETTSGTGYKKLLPAADWDTKRGAGGCSVFMRGPNERRLPSLDSPALVENREGALLAVGVVRHFSVVWGRWGETALLSGSDCIQTEQHTGRTGECMVGYRTSWGSKLLMKRKLPVSRLTGKFKWVRETFLNNTWHSLSISLCQSVAHSLDAFCYLTFNYFFYQSDMCT